MQRLPYALIPVALIPAFLVYAGLIGLGVHRQVPGGVLSLAVTGLVFGPPLLVAGTARAPRGLAAGGVLLLWSSFLAFALPLFFPGERNGALRAGLAVLGQEALGIRLVGALPEEPALSEPGPEVAAIAVAPEPPPRAPLAENQIAIPYAGRGRRLTVPVAFVHGDGKNELEGQMLLDTGATYTTLSKRALTALGITVRGSDPVVRLHTANGEREARIVLVDEVWLGDLHLKDIAIATCEECAGDDHLGLLGLNVTGGYNLFIDADAEEVVFTPRADHSRDLDVAPFLELGASFSRLPGGRVEVTARFANRSGRAFGEVVARIACEEEAWLVKTSGVPPGEEVTVRRRLPEHERCEGYSVALDRAAWPEPEADGALAPGDADR